MIRLLGFGAGLAAGNAFGKRFPILGTYLSIFGIMYYTIRAAIRHWPVTLALIIWWAYAQWQDSKLPDYVPPPSASVAASLPPPAERGVSNRSMRATREAIRAEINSRAVISSATRGSYEMVTYTIHNTSYATLVLGIIRCNLTFVGSYDRTSPEGWTSELRDRRVSPGGSFTYTQGVRRHPDGTMTGKSCDLDYEVVLP